MNEFLIFITDIKIRNECLSFIFHTDWVQKVPNFNFGLVPYIVLILVKLYGLYTIPTYIWNILTENTKPYYAKIYKMFLKIGKHIISSFSNIIVAKLLSM